MGAFLKHTTILAAFALVLLCAPAHARDLPAGGMTPEDVAAWLQANNYPATINPDPTAGAQAGNEIVSSSVDGINYDIYFFDCSPDHRCGSLQYNAGWPAAPDRTPEKANSWNHSKRFLKAYIRDDGSAFVEYDVLIAQGSYEMLDQTLARWRDSLPKFQIFLTQ